MVESVGSNVHRNYESRTLGMSDVKNGTLVLLELGDQIVSPPQWSDTKRYRFQAFLGMDIRSQLVGVCPEARFIRFTRLCTV